jgi:hypothetical protein
MRRKARIIRDLLCGRDEHLRRDAGFPALRGIRDSRGGSLLFPESQRQHVYATAALVVVLTSERNIARSAPGRNDFRKLLARRF